jgi:hypothetical protein
MLAYNALLALPESERRVDVGTAICVICDV